MRISRKLKCKIKRLVLNTFMFLTIIVSFVVFKTTNISSGLNRFIKSSEIIEDDNVEESKIQLLDLEEGIDSNTIVEGSTITGDSILKILQDTNVESGYYKFMANNKEYSVHLIVYNTDQEWTENQVFGDELDVGTSTTEAQNMVIVKVNGNVTIQDGVKVTAFSNTYGGPKGFLLYVTGTLTNNGEITMTAKGAKATGEDVYLWKNTDDTFEYVPKEGGAGGAKVYKGSGNAGTSGTKRQTGGGGSGGAKASSTIAYSGTGSSGSSYSGGTGGGAISGNSKGTNGSGNGGSGGAAGTRDSSSGKSGGGAGNPGGTGRNGGSTGENGTGGLLTIYADKYINNGSITSDGMKGGLGTTASGGSSGGGSINLFINNSTEIKQSGIITDTKYKEMLGFVTALGGSATGASNVGGAGGAGTVSIGEIRDGKYYDLKEIIEQDKEVFINKSTLEGESILKILEENDLESGYYTFKIEGTNDAGETNIEKYPVHLITYNEDQIWEENQIFGDAFDLPTATTDAQNMVIVKVNGNLTINEGVEVTALNNEYGGPKGFTLFVTGNLKNNGEISMSSKGTKAVGEDVYLWKNSDGTFEYVPKEGGAGGARVYNGAGNSGTEGTKRQTGGGGSGGAKASSTIAYSGAGGSGTSYSGGTGGGAIMDNAVGGTGSSNGASGGSAAARYTSSGTGGGGAGNPGGAGINGGSVGENGTGGLLIIYADAYTNNGIITSNGMEGGTATSGGGSSGGGSINIFANTITKEGNYNVSGGLASGTSNKGGAGGTGTVTINELNPDLVYAKKKILLNVNENYLIDINKMQFVGRNSMTVRNITLGAIEYSSLDTSVATVTNDGKITGLKNGTTKIKITDTTNNLSTYIYLEVTNNVKEDIQQGKNFTIVLKQDGTVWSYGLNNSGQLGTENNENQIKPIQIQNLNDIKEISVGYSHSLALTKDGEVYSWGLGTNGQLGNGENNNSNQPIKIQGLSNIEKIDSYKNVSLALSSDGNVYIWGDGYTSVPTLINCKYKVADISGNIILGENGFVYNLSDINTPIENLCKISKISCGQEHYLALTDNGIVYSWGKDTYGETGSQITGTISVMEIANNIFEISAGNGISYLLSEDMKAYVIGNNANGQIGLDSVAKVSEPTELNLSEDVFIRNISAGEGTHSSLIDENGFVWHTGLNTYGELGLGDNTNRKIFTKLCNNEVNLNARNEYIKIGETFDIDVLKASSFNVFIQSELSQNDWTWKSSNEDVATVDNNGIVTGKGIGYTTITGYNSINGLKAKAIINVYRNVEGAITIPQVEEGEGFTVILKEDGTVWTTGQNNYGQLGDGTTINKNVPVQVKIDENTYLTNIRKISSNYANTIALTVDGQIYAWGYNNYGQLGQGDKLNQSYAMKVKDIQGDGYLQNIVDISSSHSASLAVNNNGELLGWGIGNCYTLLGKPDAYIPVKLDGISNVVFVEAGYDDVGIILSNGETWIWGDNTKGSLGKNLASVYEIQRNIGNDIDEIQFDGYSGYILKEDDTVWGSGYNNYGQLGVGDTTDRKIFTQLKYENGDIVKAKEILPSSRNLQFIGLDGKVYVTGYNGYGQLGNKTTTNESYPIVMLNEDGTEVTDVMSLIAGVCAYNKNPRNLGIIKQDGTVWLAGDNTYGQIGNGTNTSTNYLSKLGTEKVLLNARNEYIKIGEKYDIDILEQSEFNVFIQNNLTQSDWKWESSNEDVATVDNNGIVTGKGIGHTTITGYNSKTGLKVKVIINVYRNVEGAITVPQVCVGEGYTVILKEDGTVWSVGENGVGQLGDGTTTGRKIPGQVKIDENTYLTNVKKISVGNNFVLALTIDGEVYGWGINKAEYGSGWLGQGDNVTRLYATKMKGVAGEGYIENIIDIAAGDRMSYVLNKDGDIYGAGYDNYCQITDNKTYTRAYLTKVTQISDAVQIKSGYSTFGAMLTNSEVWLKGHNRRGELGNGETADIGGTYKIGNDIKEFSLGGDKCCILKDDGTIWSTGANVCGQLGVGDTTNRLIYTQVKDSNGEAVKAKTLSGISYNLQYIGEDGNVYALGNNGYGQLSDGTTTNYNLPIKMNNNDGTDIVDALFLSEEMSNEAGAYNLGIIRKDGTVWISGDNSYGQIGNGTSQSTNYLTKFGISEVILNARNEYIKIGETYDIDVLKATEFNVFIKDVGNQSDWKWESSNEDVATVDNNGIVTGKGIGHTTITGYNSRNALKARAIINVYRNVEGAITVPQVEEGEGFTVVLKEDGTVWTSGYNEDGQLGDGTTNNKNIPVQVKIDENTYLTNVKKISSTSYQTMALTVDGDVYAWGYNNYGELGQGDKIYRKYATKVKGIDGQGYLQNIIDISMSDDTGFAVDNNGNLIGWGRGDLYTLLGENTTYVPIKLSTISNVISISVEFECVGAMISNGETLGWGHNPYGILGNGSTANKEKEIILGNDITQISFSAYSGYLLKEDGTIWSSGYNKYGQLGLGDTTDRTIYTKIKDRDGIEIKAKTIEAKGNNLQFIGIDKKVYVAGYNGYGQLCDGTEENALYPKVMLNQDKTEITDAMLLIVGMGNIGGNTDNTRNLGIIRKDGTVWLAGDNTYGQMGNGTNESTNYLTKMGDGFLNYPEKTIILNVDQTKDINSSLFNIEDDMNVFIDATSKIGNLSYEVEDENIASLDLSGRITGLKQGITKIKVTDDKLGANAYIWVKVVEQKNVQISLGHRFTLALKQDGTVWSFGQNTHGELGVGNTTSYNEPQKITEITEKIIDVKTGYHHSIALTENGEVYTWGYNKYGQLGNGNKTNSVNPIKIDGLSNIVKVDSYKYITLALTRDGEVYVWGNGYGVTPVKLNFSKKIIDISGNIVLAENRRAYNLKETESYGRDLIKISAGENHYLGLTADGEVYSWGTNKYGQLGNGNNTSSNIPSKVVLPNESGNISDIVEISAGDNYSIISDKDGNVYTFGNNSYNKLAQGTVRNKPEKIEGLSKIELVGASEGAHTAVVDWDGYVYTVGLNNYGQLGLKDKTNRASFEIVGALQIECNPNPIIMNVGDTQDISLSLSSSFNLKSDSQNNKIIDRTILNESIATISNNTVTAKSIGKTILSASYEGTIGTVNTEIRKFIRNIEVVVLPEGGNVVPKVESGNGFTVSLKADGTVWSWGQNQYGQLGLGNTVSYNEPQKISIIKETITNADGSKTEVEDIIKDIAVGNYQTLALSETGKVYSWGLGTSGQLGIGNKKNKYTPVVVTDIYGKPLEDIVKVEAGEKVSFAIDSKGNVYAWGYGYTTRAQKLDVVDNGLDVTSKYVLSADGNVYSISTKERLPVVGNIVELDEGKNHTVMLTSEGKGYSIGDNTYGQLGNGNNVSSNDTPVAIRNINDELFTNIKEIKAGDQYTIIVTNDGKVYTVGINDNNELGIENTEILDRSLPEINENIENVIFATAGDNHVTVIKNDGTVYSWGDGELGQLGNRKNKDSITPVMVGDYIVRTNTNRVVLSVNSEKIIEGTVDYFNVFNNNPINVSYNSKDSSVVELANTQTGNTQVTSTLNANNKFEIKLIGKKFGTTIVTANQEDSTNIGVIQVEVIPEGKEIEPMVETSGSHTITLRVDGKVFTYGDNTYGELGNGTTVSSDEPVEVKFPEGIKIIQIAVGEYHNVALDNNGNVWTWGRNNNYQIGHSKGNQYTPYKVTGLPKVIKVSAGNNNTMVITENNELYGWGLNAYGDLGVGNYTNKLLPTKIKGIKDIIDISGGKSHYIALNRSGEVFTTGSNLYGQLGIGQIEKNKINEFTKIEIDEKIGTINVGELSNIVTTIDGYVYAWGANTYGQLGTNDNTNKNKPTRIENVQNIRQVNMGKTHAIIRDGNNKVYITGGNTYGQLGIGTKESKTIFEENVRITNVLRVSAGNTYTNFLREDGFVWACGDYNHGDKTKKSKTNSKVPVLVGSDASSLENLEIVIMKSDIKSIMANAKFKFNLIYVEENDTSDFEYSSYNEEVAKVNQDGDILGVREGTTWVKAVDGNTGKEHIAIVRVIDNTKEYSTHVAPKVVAGENFALGLKEDGTVWTWGYDNSRLAETNIPSNLNVLSTYKDVTAGKNHGLAIRENGTVWSVGNNEYGQLGIGNTDNKSKLVQVEGLTDVISIAGGESHSIAMDSFGIIYGFGANDSGQLGNEYIGSNTTSPVVITIPNERVLQISAGKDQSVFVTANGTVYGMGSVLNGYIPNITDAVKAEVGDGYVLILRTDGSIYRYQYGVLTKVPNVSNAIDISVQNKVNMYQSIDEKTYTWGINTYGGLGNGTTTSTSVPTEPIENGTNVFRIGAGYNNTYIISNTGFVYASGTNTFGELGNGTNENEESTTKELSLTHTLVGDRNFTIKPESNTLEINEVENLNVESNTFNVFRNDKKDLSEYDWKSEDGTILVVLGDGIVQGINLGTTKVIATDKVTGQSSEGTRVVVPLDTDRIESITASGKEADVTDAYQYEVKIPVDENVTKSNVTIRTKLETDDISIDGGTTWVKGALSTVVDIQDELTIVPFIVKTEAGNELNYTLTIIKISNNNNLANITIKTAESNMEVPATKVEDKVYEAVAPGTGVHKVKVTSEHDKAYVSIRGLTKQLKEQTYNLVMTKPVEEIPIKITSESGKEENYTLFVYREDYVATLKNIVVNGVLATKVSDDKYEVTINKTINESEVIAITNLSTATIGINDGIKQVNKITQNIQTVDDKNIVTIQVEEPNTGLAKEYTLTINKNTEEEPDNPDNPEIKDDVAIEKILVNELLGNSDIEAVVSEEERNVYEVYLQNAVQKVEVTAITKDTSSQIKIANNDYAISQDTKEIELDSTLTEILINVRSDFGTEKEYVLRIYTISDNTRLQEVTVGTEFATYNSITGRYEIKVDKNLTQYDITAKAEENNAILEVNDKIEIGTIDTTISKTGEETVVPIKVKAPNGISEEVYELVILEKSDIADIEIVRVNGTEIIPEDDGNYIANIISTTEEVKIFAQTIDEYADITIDSETNNENNITITRQISQDSTTYNIEVLAEDGVTRVTKQLTINRLSGNTEVQSVLVQTTDGNSYTALEREDGVYYCKVPRNETVDVTVTLADSKARVSIANGTPNLQTSTENIILLDEITEVNAIIEAEDGTQSTIIIQIEKQSNDASLLKIIAPLATKVSRIDGSKYEIQVDDRLEKLIIDAITTNENAQIKLGTEDIYTKNKIQDKEIDLNGIDSFTIDVLAEDGETAKTYTVELTRKFSTEIKSITTDLEPAIKNGYIYNGFVDNDNIANIEITADNPLAEISVYKNDELLGNNIGVISLADDMLVEKEIYRIIVTGPNSESSEYILYLTKKSTNNNIEYVKVNGETLTENIETGRYEIEVGTVENNEYILEVKAEDNFARISLDNGEYSDSNKVIENYVINPGDTKEVSVKVKSQNGEEITKIVSIYRKDNNIEIQSIKINDIVVNNYNEKNKNYSIILDNTIDLADLEIILTSDKSTIETSIDGTDYKDIKSLLVRNIILPGVGKKVISFKVTAEDGTEETRTITISQFSSNIELQEVKVNGKLANKRDDGNYEITIGDKPSTASVFAKAEELDSTIIINNVGTGKLSENTTNIGSISEGQILDIPIKVISADGTEYEYRLYITVKSANNNIEYVKVNNKDAEKINDTTYRIFVNNTENQATIDIKALSENAIITTNIDGIDKSGNPLNFVQSLIEEKTNVKFVVTSEAKEEKEYTLEIIKESNDNTIKNVYVNGIELQKDEETGRYKIAIKEETGNPVVKVITNNEYAYIRIGVSQEEQGQKEERVELKETKITTIPITIRSQTGVTSVEYLDIEKIFTECKIDTIVVDDKEVTDYNSSTKTYTALVDSKITEHEIFIMSANTYSTLEINNETGVGNITTFVTIPDEELEKELTLKVISESGEEETYKVRLVKKSNNVRVKEVIVNDVLLSPEEGHPDIYKKTIEQLADKAKIKVVTEYPYSQVKIADCTEAIGVSEEWIELDIKEDVITIPVLVTGADGETIATYNIILNRMLEEEKTSISGKILTENHEEKHKSLVTIYKTNDTRQENEVSDPREIIKQLETEEDGTFIVEVEDIEKYDIVVTKDGYLDYRVTDIEVIQGETIILDEHKILAGDVVKTGEIEIDDLVTITDKYGISIENQEGEIDENAKYDLNEDGIVNELDIEILKGNYSKKTEVEKWINPNAIMEMSLKESTENEEIVESIYDLENEIYNQEVIKDDYINSVKTSEKGEELEKTEEFILPMKCDYRITSEYGIRIHPVTGEEKKHTGIDISGIHHTEIYAVAEGEVTFAGVKNGFGNCIEIKHIVNGETIYSFYAHLSEIRVAQGQKISQGEVIALEGGDPSSDPNPGSSTGHHLHFEIRKASGYGNDVDPNEYIKF